MNVEFGCYDDDCLCIVLDWKCDGILDCFNNRDEMDCDVILGKYCDLYLLYGVVVKFMKNFFFSLNFWDMFFLLFLSDDLSWVG